MGPIHCVALASLVLLGAVAQSADSSGGSHKVWAAVAFVNHGETTPQLGPLDTILTPEGAQQLFRQGTAFRSRYLSVNNKDPGAEAAPIRNISQSAINNGQLTAWSLQDEYVVGGATAFFQGLYPSSTGVYHNEAGGMDTARNLPLGDNLTTYPLDGYQYAQIQTFSNLDIQFPTLQGTSGCNGWEAEVAQLTSSNSMKQSFRGSYRFYQDLFTSGPLEGLIDPADADYWKASEIYDLVNYMYTHNTTVFRQLEDANNTLALLEANALELQTSITSPQPDNTDDFTDTILTIGGRTLAHRLEYQLGASAQSDGQYSKLTVMFGSHLPMMSFFHLAKLKSVGNSSSDPFSQLPRPGSAMVFELIGNNEDEMTAMPAVEDLRVRFVYRDGADEDATFEPAALFNSNAADQGLPWSDFSRLMRDVGVDPSTWCSICQSTTAPWCVSADGDSVSGSEGISNSAMGPVLAGAIGAVVTLVVTGLLGLALFFVGGFRLRRSKSEGDRVATGGFKGTERMPGDKDVTIDKGGAQRERVGSWELRDEAGAPPAFNGAGIVTSDFHRRNENATVDDDEISVTGARVVNTRESV